MEDGLLVVELPGLRTPFVAFTARHPTCTTEMVLMPQPASRGGQGLTATFLVSGLRPSMVAELRPLVEGAYPGLRMWQSGGAAGAWLGQFSFAADQLEDRTARAIIAFLEKEGLGESWVRTQGGATSFRIHVRATTDATALAEKLRSHLAAAGASGQVQVVRAQSSAGDGWRDLLQYATHSS